MMNPKDLAPIIDEYKNKLRKEGVEINDGEISGLVKAGLEEARETYDKLSEPKLMPLDPYLSHWVREKLIEYLFHRTTKKVSPDSTDTLSKAFHGFLKILPPRLQEELKSELSKEKSYEKRREIWERKKLPIDEIEHKFIDLVKARNERAKEKGFTSFISQSVDQYQIPEVEYERFKANIDKVIKYCNDNLPLIKKPSDFYSEFQQPCYLCEIPFPKIAYPDEVIKFVAGEYPILTEYEDRITIVPSDSPSIRYKKEDDKFEIKIGQKLNNRHKTVDLIHELSHAVIQIEEYKNGVDPLQLGKFHEEKKDVEINLPLLKQLSPEVYKAYLAEILLLIRRELFEIAVYENPDQKLGRFYADLLNRCFPEANQKDNPFYLFEKRIVFRPLSSLPQTVASVNMLALQEG